MLPENCRINGLPENVSSICRPTRFNLNSMNTTEKIIEELDSCSGCYILHTRVLARKICGWIPERNKEYNITCYDNCRCVGWTENWPSQEIELTEFNPFNCLDDAAIVFEHLSMKRRVKVIVNLGKLCGWKHEDAWEVNCTKLALTHPVKMMYAIFITFPELLEEAY